MKTILLATAALLTAVTLAACGDEDPAPTADDETSALSLDDLDGRVFASVRVDGHDLVRATTVRLGFAGSELSADAGCNHLFGTVGVDADALVVSDMGSTEMGCAAELMEQDAWLTEFLTAGPSAELAADTLTLTGGDVVIELVEQPAPTAPTGDPDEPTADSFEGDDAEGSR